MAGRNGLATKRTKRPMNWAKAAKILVPVLIILAVAGTSVGFMQRLRTSGRYARSSNILRIVMGAAMMLIGLYMFYLGF